MIHERNYFMTPNGGDYSDIYFLNEMDYLVDKIHATKYMVRECRFDGSLVFEKYVNIAKEV